MAELRKAAKQGNLGKFYGNAADFRTRLAIAETKARQLSNPVLSGGGMGCKSH